MDLPIENERELEDEDLLERSREVEQEVLDILDAAAVR